MHRTAKGKNITYGNGKENRRRQSFLYVVEWRKSLMKRTLMASGKKPHGD
jgi:hypothetical protein